MQYDPSPLEVLFVWGLVAEGGAGLMKDLKPKLEKKNRERLEKAGLMTVAPQKQKNRALGVELTDKGWAWAADHLDAEISARSPAAGPILRAWLIRLKGYIANNDVALAEIIGGQHVTNGDGAKSADRDAPVSDASQGLPQRIADAYLSLSGGHWARRVRIAHLRDKLKDVSRQKFDAILLDMQRQGRLALYTLDDPRQVSTDDEKAAIHIGPATRHIVYMENNFA
jgi:hypothetical protein